jgi:hypothetical protein
VFGLSDKVRKREVARRYREAHREEIRLYVRLVKKRERKYRDVVFQGFLRNPRGLLDSVEVRVK